MSTDTIYALASGHGRALPRGRGGVGRSLPTSAAGRGGGGRVVYQSKAALEAAQRTAQRAVEQHVMQQRAAPRRTEPAPVSMPVTLSER